MSNSGDTPKSNTLEIPPGWVIITDISGHKYYLNVSTNIIKETHPSLDSGNCQNASNILPSININNVNGMASDILNYISMKDKMDMVKSDINISKTKQKRKNRCEFCKKKSLILFNCKCGLNTCLKHKDPETHCCSYDFKQDNVLGVKCEFSKLIKINE